MNITIAKADVDKVIDSITHITTWVRDILSANSLFEKKIQQAIDVLISHQEKLKEIKQ